MRKIASIIHKNFKLILRSKTSALVILLGPLLIMVIVGLAFNNQAGLTVNVGYHSDTYNDLTNSFVDVLNSSGYNIVRFDTVKMCEDDIGAGNIHICIDFPADFAISNNRTNTIIFLVDNSKINLFESVVDSIESDFNARAMDLSTGLTQDLVNKLNDTQATITDKASLLAQLKDENRDEKDRAAVIYGAVKGLDLSFNPDDLDMDEIEDSASDMQSALSDLESIAEDAIDEGLDLVDELYDDVGDSNMTSSEKASFRTLLNDSGDNLLDLKDDLNTTVVDSEAVTGLLTSISDVKKNINNLETRLKKSSSSRDQTLARISELQAKLDATRDKILLVEAVFNAISANIASTEVTDVSTIVQPIRKEVQPVITDESQLNFYFPYLVMLIVMFIGVLLSSILVIMEKTSRAYFRNFVTPTRDSTFIMGSYFTTMIILSFQLLIILLIFSLYFGRDIMSNLQAIVAILLLSFTMFSFIGMIIGYLFSTEETGTLASISISAIFLFISDLVFPLERMPPYIADIARNYNPFVMLSDLLRRSLVHSVRLSQLSEKIYVVLLYLIALLVVLVLAHKMMKKHVLMRYSGYLARREFKKKARLDAERRMLEIVRAIPTEKYFRAHDGSPVKSFDELIKYIEALDDQIFSRYVSKDMNYFADWIHNVLKNPDLADKVRKAKKKKACLKVLSEGKKEYNRMEKKIVKLDKKAQNRAGLSAQQRQAPPPAAGRR